MNDTDIFSAMFGGTTKPQSGFKIININDSNLERYRKVCAQVRERVKESKLTIEFNIESKELAVHGTAKDLYYFGYFTKELESSEQ